MKLRVISVIILLLLTSGAIMASRVEQLPIYKVGEEDFHVYEASKRESVYGVSRILDIDVDDILKYNPSAIDGLKKGQKLFFPVSNQAVAVVGADDNVVHVVAKGETLYGLSRRYNVSQELILEMNPEINSGLKVGVELIIPMAEESEESEALIEVPEQVNRENYVYLPVVAGGEVDEVINIALIFPFDLDNKVVSNDAKFFTEFYKGVLLAVDSVRSELGRELNIYAYDTKSNGVTVAGILDESVMKDMDLIYLPNNAVDMELICDFADKYNINVANTFFATSENYNEQRSFFQANIPQSYLLSKTVDYVASNFKDYKFVFVNDTTASDSKPIVESLKMFAQSNSAEAPVVLNIDKDSNAIVGLDSLFANYGDKVMIVPSSASRLTLMKVLLDLDRTKNSRYGSDLILFGHPEWITYGDMYNYLCKYNSYVYSRFFVDEKDDRYVDFLNRFINVYGGGMKTSSPNFALLGFDSAIYYLSALDENGGDFNDYNLPYNGIQSDYIYERVNDDLGGFVNQAMYIINFMNGGRVKRITIF